MEVQEGSLQPHLVLAHKLFLLSHPDVDDIEKVRLRDEVVDAVKIHGNDHHNHHHWIEGDDLVVTISFLLVLTAVESEQTWPRFSSRSLLRRCSGSTPPFLIPCGRGSRTRSRSSMTSEISSSAYLLMRFLPLLCLILDIYKWTKLIPNFVVVRRLHI